MDEIVDSGAIDELKNQFQTFKTCNKLEPNWRLQTLLHVLGLTKYEVQAYIALIEGGEQHVSDIITKTGIPQPRAYDTLVNLTKYGLVTPEIQVNVSQDKKQKRTLKTYRAFEPSIGIGNLFSYYEYAKEESIIELQKLVSAENRSESGIWEIYGEKNIINMISSMAGKAKYEILISSDFEFVKKICHTLNKACERNVQISCVTILDEKDAQLLSTENFKYLKIRHRSHFPMPYVIIDRTMAIQWNFIRSKKTGVYANPENIQAQVIERLHLIDTLIDHFFILNWRTGKLFNSSRRLPLPATFVNIFTAFEEIEYQMSLNIRPKVKISGFNHQTHEPKSASGEVIDVRKDWDTATFTIYIRTETGEKISFGGFGAYLEDIAADMITVYK